MEQVRSTLHRVRGWVCAGCRSGSHCYGGAFCFCRKCGGNSRTARPGRLAR